MSERYGIPYIEESFYGATNLNRCLRNIAAKLSLFLEDRVVAHELQESTEKLIAQETADLVIAVTDGKTTHQEKAKIRQYVSEDGMVFSNTTPQAILKVLKQTKADVLIAGAGNKYTALKAQIPFLDINHERDHPYAGYTGLVVLARELHEALYSPTCPVG